MRKREFFHKLLSVPAAIGGMLLADKAMAKPTIGTSYVGALDRDGMAAEVITKTSRSPVHQRFIGRDLHLLVNGVNLGGCDLKLSWDGQPEAHFEWSGFTNVYWSCGEGMQLNVNMILRRSPKVTGAEQLIGWDKQYPGTVGRRYVRYLGPRLHEETNRHHELFIENLKLEGLRKDGSWASILNGDLHWGFARSSMDMHALLQDFALSRHLQFEPLIDVTTVHDGPRIRHDSRLDMKLIYLLG